MTNRGRDHVGTKTVGTKPSVVFKRKVFPRQRYYNNSFHIIYLPLFSNSLGDSTPRNRKLDYQTMPAIVSVIALKDRFQILTEKENRTQFEDYLSPSHQLDCFCSNLGTAFTYQDACDLSEHKNLWRNNLCAWMYNVVDNLDMDRELVEISLCSMDIYLAKAHIHDASGFKLAAMTSLYLAMKVYGRQGTTIGIDCFAKLSRGLFTTQDFMLTEQAILDVLSWRVHPPTSLNFLELLMMFLPQEACSLHTRLALYDRIKFLLELCVTVQYFVGKRPSIMAIAAFIEVVQHEESPNIPIVQYHNHFCECVLSICGVDCDSNKVLECIEVMIAVHKNAAYDIKEDIILEPTIHASDHDQRNEHLNCQMQPDWCVEIETLDSMNGENKEDKDKVTIVTQDSA